MKGRRSPIDRMRELADDGLEPWQIAAALGVREDAVLVALDADEPAGGAQRAVEDARALAEHVAVTVCGPDDEDEDEDVEPDPDSAEGPRCPDCGTEDCQVIPYCTPGDVDVEEAAADHLADVVNHAIETGEPLPPEHVHDPFPVVDETGVWHAECECGHRWDRSPCEYSGCTAYVAALHIARTGTSRHAHHPA